MPTTTCTSKTSPSTKLRVLPFCQCFFGGCTPFCHPRYVYYMTPPPPCAPSAWRNNEINVGGWCCFTHLFGVETNDGTQDKWKNRQRTQLGVWPLQGVCHAPHSHTSSNEEQTSERSDDVSRNLMVASVQVPVRKIQERLPTAWGYRINCYFFPYVSVCVLVCAIWTLSNTTNAHQISTRAASVPAPYLPLHPPLLVFKAVLSSWRLVVMCALVATERFQLELNYRRVPACTKHYTCTSIHSM